LASVGPGTAVEAVAEHRTLVGLARRIALCSALLLDKNMQKPRVYLVF